jgi:pimeloyl-ACP methyl ester carboxylesterase
MDCRSSATRASLENLAEDVKTVVLGLDLHDVVLVGHSMGGVAVQEFVTRYPELAAERVVGIVFAVDARIYALRFPIDSHQSPDREAHQTHARRDMLWERRNLGLLAARLGFGKNPHPSHVELVRRMMVECAPETRRDAPRVLIGLDLTEALPNIRIPTLVIGGTADALTPPAGGAAALARPHPGRAARAARGWRPHADARTDRAAESPHRRLCPGGQGRSTALGVGAGVPAPRRGGVVSGLPMRLIASPHCQAWGSRHCDSDSNVGNSEVWLGAIVLLALAGGAALTAAQAARAYGHPRSRAISPKGRASDAVVNANTVQRRNPKDAVSLRCKARACWTRSPA